MKKKPRILILGAGYGGMMTASRLSKQLGNDDAEILLVNKHNYHYQTTWLHEPAAGTLHHDRTRMRIDSVIDTNKVKFIKGVVVDIKPTEQRVILEDGELTYDYLVVGLGSEPETFGIPGVEEHAFSIRSVNSVRQIREHIEYMFASYNNSDIKQAEKLCFVIAGGGFTGIEFVGELTERIPELCKEYDIDRKKVRIISVEASTTALPGFDSELSEYAMNLLESRGVEFLTNTTIKEVKENGVLLASGEELQAKTVIWTTGVRGNAVLEKSGFETTRGRIKVAPDLRVNGVDNVFIVGDCTLVFNEETNYPYPPTAQIAIQQSYTIAKNLKALLLGTDKLEEFKPNIKGTVASLGGREAVGIVGERKLYGTSAATMKKIIDNRYLFLLGGLPLVVKKGKLNLFS